MIIEGMRTDSLMFAGLRVSQWLSMILILVELAIIPLPTSQKAPYYVETKETNICLLRLHMTSWALP